MTDWSKFYEMFPSGGKPLFGPEQPLTPQLGYAIQGQGDPYMAPMSISQMYAGTPHTTSGFDPVGEFSTLSQQNPVNRRWLENRSAAQSGGTGESRFRLPNSIANPFPKTSAANIAGYDGQYGVSTGDDSRLYPGSSKGFKRGTTQYSTQGGETQVADPTSPGFWEKFNFGRLNNGIYPRGGAPITVKGPPSPVTQLADMFTPAPRVNPTADSVLLPRRRPPGGPLDPAQTMTLADMGDPVDMFTSPEAQTVGQMNAGKRPILSALAKMFMGNQSGNQPQVATTTAATGPRELSGATQSLLAGGPSGWKYNDGDGSQSSDLRSFEGRTRYR